MGVTLLGAIVPSSRRPWTASMRKPRWFFHSVDYKLSSSFRSDGSRRKPPPSAMHGWLAKMRGTLIGNEDLRSKGIREMRDAGARKRYVKEKAQRSQSGSLFSFLSLRKNKDKRQPARLSRRPQGTGPSRPSPRPANTTHGSRAVRPPPRPSGTSQRSSDRNHRPGPSSRPGYSRRSSRR
ncbi:unnamed protein product [Cyclocybe aegerita]|uniref:Uncharacterized protein n=1 Tax=Cyclocybe aegerita TaxID=1973307 RepID=A0A8S0W7D0_CYCAE|nr:unnamed protein product [Cyclocybe aegerita]